MKNLTPQALRCGMASCPAVHEIDGDKLLIVGKHQYIHTDDVGETWLTDIGNVPVDHPTEAAVIIDRALLGDLFRDEVEKAVQAERERCAGIAEKWFNGEPSKYYTTMVKQTLASEIAVAIRSTPSQEDKP